jgi:hypothetical protein
LSKKKKIKRKSFAAREDLLEQLNVIAKENDLSLYKYVNDVFELTIRANEMGITFDRLLNSRELLNDAKDNGYTLGLESIWYSMVDLAYTNAKRKSLDTWFEAGVWSAKRYMTGKSVVPLETFVSDLKDFTWNIPELDLKSSGNKLSVRVVSPRLPESYTMLFMSFLEGAIQTFGYQIETKDTSRGIICLNATKK